MSDELDLGELEKSLKDLNTKISGLRTEAAEQSKAAFNKMIKVFFETTPEIVRVVWTQYTPHFCDGDPCRFGVHEPSFYRAEDADEDDYEFNPYAEPGSWCDQSSKDIYAEVIKTDPRFKVVQKNIEKFYKMFNLVDYEYFEMMFGDGVQVTATKDGFDIDEYSHD